jgi:hypothetical protein
VNRENVPVNDHDEPPVTGFVRFVDDSLKSRMEAHAADGELPSQWTPEHVVQRMIQAFEVLARMPGRVGPMSKSGHWPSILREFADLVDAQSTTNKAAEFWAGRGDRVSSIEASMMDEALAWPMVHLAGLPLMADALTLHCWCQAAGREIEPLLRRRRIRADSKAKRMASELEAAHPERAQARRALASEVAAWANDRMAAGETQRDIRKQAAIRMREACTNNGCMPITVALTTALPGVIIHRKTLDRQRKRAAEIVAKALKRASVPIR